MPQARRPGSSPAATAALARGHGLMAAGRVGEAIARFREAAGAAPADPAPHRALASALRAHGAAGEAIAAGLRALALAPGDPETIGLVSGLLQGRTVTGLRLRDDEARAVRRAFTDANAEPAAFAGLAMAHLKSAAPMSEAFAILRDRGEAEAGAWLAGRAGRRARGDPLLAALLCHALVADAEFERLLAGARRALVHAPAEAWGGAGFADFAAALATQCAIGEFAWFETLEETASAEAMAAALARLAQPGPADQPLLLKTALYRPLAALPNAEALLAARARLSEPVRGLIDRTLAEALAERALRAGIASLGGPAAGVSAAVQAQYEESPYPRWVHLRLPEAGSWKSALAGFFSPADLAFPRPFAVLVPGCGTGRQAIAAAARYRPDAAVTAVDLSLASLAYARRMAERYGVANLDLAQADLLALPAAGRRYRVIECAGVLHHLADPADGLAALVACLEPGGLIRLALYSARARRAVNAVRARIADAGIPATPDGMRGFRQALLAAEDPESRAVREQLRDVYSLSGCRDLLFHVQEHQFTLPALGALLTGAGLEFRGFALPRSVLAAFARRFPRPGAPRDLAAWDAFEADNPDTFLGMYDFWCRAPDRPTGG